MLIGASFSSATVLFTQSPAYAQSSAPETLKGSAITVRINGATQGSGVLVAKDGNTYTVLTAWHVIKPNMNHEEIDITTVDGETHSTSMLKAKRIGSLDMAVIKFDSNRNYRVAQISTRLPKKSVLFVLGFPQSTGIFLSSTGQLIANAELGIDQGYQLLYSNNTMSGMSGGPILNLNTELVGIHGRGERSQDHKLGNNKKTNVNQGIPIFYYKQFAEGLDIASKRTEAVTWSDYYALLNSTNQSNFGDAIDLRQTQIRLLGKMIKLRPKGSLGYVLRGGIKKQLDPTLPELDSDTQKGLQLIGEWLELLKRARKLFTDDRFEEALSLFDAADQYVTEMGSDNYMLKARIYLAQGKYKDAMDQAEKALALELDAYSDSRSTLSYRMGEEFVIAASYGVLGESHAHFDQHKAALENFKQQIKWLRRFDLLRSNDGLNESDIRAMKARSFAKMAYLSKKVGESDKKICDYIALAYRNGAENTSDLYRRCSSAMSSEYGYDPVEVNSLFSDLGEVNTGISIAKAYIQRGLFSEAQVTLEALIEKDPLLPSTYYFLGFTRYSLGDYNSCIMYMDRALSLSPRLHSAFFDRANCKEGLSDFDGAVSDYAEALALKPAQDIFNNVSIMYFNKVLKEGRENEFKVVNTNRFNVQKALNLVSRALDYSPMESGYLEMAGRLHLFLGQMNQSCTFLGKAASLGHKNASQLISALKAEKLCN